MQSLQGDSSQIPAGVSGADASMPTADLHRPLTRSTSLPDIRTLANNTNSASGPAIQQGAKGQVALRTQLPNLDSAPPNGSHTLQKPNGTTASISQIKPNDVDAKAKAGDEKAQKSGSLLKKIFAIAAGVLVAAMGVACLCCTPACPAMAILGIGLILGGAVIIAHTLATDEAKQKAKAGKDKGEEDTTAAGANTPATAGTQAQKTSDPKELQSQFKAKKEEFETTKHKYNRVNSQIATQKQEIAKLENKKSINPDEEISDKKLMKRGKELDEADAKLAKLEEQAQELKDLARKQYSALNDLQKQKTEAERNKANEIELAKQDKADKLAKYRARLTKPDPLAASSGGSANPLYQNQGTRGTNPLFETSNQNDRDFLYGSNTLVQGLDDSDSASTSSDIEPAIKAAPQKADKETSAPQRAHSKPRPAPPDKKPLPQPPRAQAKEPAKPSQADQINAQWNRNSGFDDDEDELEDLSSRSNLERSQGPSNDDIDALLDDLGRTKESAGNDSSGPNLTADEIANIIADTEPPPSDQLYQ